MKKIAVIYGGPDDEYNFYGERVKSLIENIDKEKYEIVQIFMTQDSSFKVFNPKHTNKKLFFSLNKIFKFLKDQNVKLVLLMLAGEYGKSLDFQNKLKENEIQFVEAGENNYLFINSEEIESIILKEDTN